MTGVGGASGNCKQILKNQANRTNIDDLYAITQECGDGTNRKFFFFCIIIIIFIYVLIFDDKNSINVL